MEGPMSEEVYNWNRKSTSKQAMVLLIKICFAFIGY